MNREEELREEMKVMGYDTERVDTFNNGELTTVILGSKDASVDVVVGAAREVEGGRITALERAIDMAIKAKEESKI